MYDSIDLIFYRCALKMYEYESSNGFQPFKINERILLKHFEMDDFFSWILLEFFMKSQFTEWNCGVEVVLVRQVAKYG